MTDIDKALAYTLVNEGGYSDNPADHGGKTRYGITQATLSRWLQRPASVNEIKTLSKETARAIYQGYYWHPLGCDQLKSQAIATCLFDIGVVRGISVPPKYAQLVCNQHGFNLVVDGQLGPKSMNALDSIDPTKFIIDYAAMVKKGFESIVARNLSQKVFLKGWTNRANRLLTLVAN